MSCERSLCSWSKDSIAAGFIDHNESDDDAPQLSVEALTALREFYAEQMIAQEQRQDSVTQSMPKEDWVSFYLIRCAHRYNNTGYSMQ